VRLSNYARPDNAADIVTKCLGGEAFKLTPELVPLAQQLAGTVGFVATMARPDAYFGYCAIARHVNAARLTKHSFNMLLRLCHYIVSTKNMVLTLTSRERSNHHRK
jgi:hypothetical protein